MAEYALLIGAIALVGLVGAARLGATISGGAAWVAQVIRNA
jgi:Flp pilus assembly pilin Flp